MPKREDNVPSLQLSPRPLTSSRHLTSKLRYRLVVDIFEGIDGSGGVFCGRGHVKDAAREEGRELCMRGEFVKSLCQNKLADHFSPSRFVRPSSMMYSRGFGGRMGLDDGVG